MLRRERNEVKEFSPDEQGDSSDSVEYDEDDGISKYERRAIKLKRRRKRAFLQEFNAGEALNVSNLLPVLAPQNRGTTVKEPRKRKSVTPMVVLQPRKSLRLSGQKTDYSFLDDDDLKEHKRKSFSGKRRTSTPRIRFRHVEFNPDALTGSVCYNSAKVYSTSGTTCHQCRQKTTDLKSQCYSSTCVGVRGQFCGCCLLGRYGEDVAVVLRDKNWKCPPCRRICNCSICRRQNGKPPTGQLKHVAHMKGYGSVVDYLKDKGDALLEDDDLADEDVDVSAYIKEEIVSEDERYEPLDLGKLCDATTEAK